MSAKGNNGSYKVLMQLWSNELTNDDNPPAFYLSRPNIRAVYTSNYGETTDDVHLLYFKEPKSTAYPLDLNKGFDQFIFRQKSKPSQVLAKVQKFVLESEDNVLKPNASIPDAEFRNEPQAKSKRKVVLGQRGVLTRIMLVPYRLTPSEYNSYTFSATRYCGILHLTDVDWRDEQNKNGSYHGKFAQSCFSDDPDLDPITSVPVDENNITFCVYHTTMKEFDLIYSAEINGIISDHKIADM
ncbi:PREDICTED: uncharacterized protein LOC108354389 isoform X1 [Rhagoletis zephyria]|uniref:uncharacterized protein LOC108354389 isoform X1 n=1 Tax=Rhagoletis zephyria TaxID=28612 RepID=UPI0008118FC1|nr:PREDICTED: uncharacterized protein LOC108354389 isoform X1 [Rhagoletis zephyria]